MMAPMKVITAPNLVWPVSLYQIDKLKYTPRNRFANNKMGTTTNPVLYFSLIANCIQGKFIIVPKNKNKQNRIKYFIINAFKVFEFFEFALLKKNGSAANLNA